MLMYSFFGGRGDADVQLSLRQWECLCTAFFETGGCQCTALFETLAMLMYSFHGARGRVDI